MTTNKKTARLAGLIYLGIVITGIFSILYVPSQIIIWDDPAATVRNLSNNTNLYKWSIVGSFVCYLLFLFLPLVVYKLLESVNKQWASVMVVLALVSIPISFLNLNNSFVALTLVGDNYSSLLTPNEIETQVMLYLDQKSFGTLIAQIFWGLWLFPFGYLVYKSGFLPKVIGVFLMIGCFSYITDTVGYLFFDGYSQTILSNITGIPSALGEFGICLWMLLFGIKE